MREGQRERSAVALGTRHHYRAQYPPQRAGLQRDGERIETTRVEPDQRAAEGHERQAEPRPCKSRQNQEEFGAHAVQESHGGRI